MRSDSQNQDQSCELLVEIAEALYGDEAAIRRPSAATPKEACLLSILFTYSGEVD